MWSTLKGLEADDVLGLVGLQARRTTLDTLLPALGVFGLGLVVGAGVGLLLAPTTGEELRDDLRRRLESASDGVKEKLSSVAGSASSAASAGSSERSPRAV